MLSHRRAVALVLLLSAARAAADVAPPPGYVETCSLDKQRRAGEDCVSCNTYFAEADACQKQHAGRGYARRCRTRGASTWSEVWCKSSSGVAVNSMGEERDAEGPLPSEATPTASASASAPQPPTPTGSAAPSAQSATDTRGTPTGASSAPQPPSSHPAPGEKSGSCGACQVGRVWPATAPLMLAGGALLAAWARRRRAMRASRRSLN